MRKKEREEKLKRERLQMERGQAERQDNLEREKIALERERMKLERKKTEKEEKLAKEKSELSKEKVMPQIQLLLFREANDKFDSYIWTICKTTRLAPYHLAHTVEHAADRTSSRHILWLIRGTAKGLR